MSALAHNPGEARGVGPLDSEDANVVFVPMLTTSQAVDLFLGDFSRRSRSKNGKSTNDYRRILYKFSDALPANEDVSKITADECRRFLDRFQARSAGTQGTNYSILNSFLHWLYDQERIKVNPLSRVPRPKRIAAEDLDVTTVSTADMPRLLGACRTHTERLSFAIPAYLGPRRNAIAVLRLRDYDQAGMRLRFQEKGSKTIWKPIPRELATLLDAAIVPAEENMVPQHRRGNVALPTDYLVPPEGKLSRKGDRDDRVIWRVVKRVADREGIEAHVHALRAAFAIFYLESNTGDLEALRELMGHSSLQTTQIYLRKLDKQVAMERVRSLSWAGNTQDASSPQIAEELFASLRAVGAGGFEPPSADSQGAVRLGSQRRPSV